MNVDELFKQSLDFSAEMAQQFSYVVNDDLTLRQVRGAVVTPRRYFANRTYTGAVYDGMGNLIGSTQRFNTQDIVPVDPLTLPTLDGIAAAEHHSGPAIYGGILFPILGHFCFETLGRFWPLVDMARREASAGLKMPICFHHWPGLDLGAFFDNPFYRYVFSRFGLDMADVVLIDRPMSFDTLLLPDRASIYHVNLHSEMTRVFEFLVDQRSMQGTLQRAGRKVYLSRSRWGDNQRVVNEVEVEQELAARGIEIVHTQDLQPDALLSLLQDIEVLVTTDGSHAHLATFCRPGTRSVMLDTRPVPTQVAIERLRSIRAVHVPLYRSAIYSEGRINDVQLLGQVIDRAIDHLTKG